MRGEQWIMIAKFCHEMYFADTLVCEKYRSLKQHYKQMMQAQLQSQSSVCRFYTIMQFFISSSSVRKLLLEFKTLLYSVF